ncbi:unnamed protein product [Cylindrotheca closterium]|uniref:SIR2-like domain-containing protein n=1 Tax=Cylindrotheca closterium TaxID=2856 RepID=A0AAD2GAZ7_9STRA|nr:unnamed protein product [Cylindrotheca closterium]
MIKIPSKRTSSNKAKDLAESGVATVLSVDQWKATPDSKCDCPKDETVSVNFICMHPDGADGDDDSDKAPPPQTPQTDTPGLAQAARYQEIFLDKVGMLYAVQDAASRHVLDDRFDSFLSDGEKQLKDSLLTFLKKASPKAKATHAFSYLEKLLKTKMGYQDMMGRGATRTAAKRLSYFWKPKKESTTTLPTTTTEKATTSTPTSTATSSQQPSRPLPTTANKSSTPPSQQQSPKAPNPGHVFVCNSSVCDIQCDAFLCPGHISRKKENISGSIFHQWYKGSLAAELMRKAKGMDEFQQRQQQRRVGTHQKLQQHQGYDRVVTIQEWPQDSDAFDLPLLIAGEVSLESQLHAYNLACDKSERATNTEDLPPDDFRVEFLLETVRQFLELASTLVQQQGTKKPNVHRERYLLAVPILGTGGGYAGDMTGQIVYKLLEMVTNFVASSTPNMDVVVVTVDDATYAHAQVIRKNQLGESSGRYPCFAALSKSQNDYAAQLASLAEGRHLALFVGAGVSIGSGLPSWFGLLNLVEDAFTPTGNSSERSVGDDCDWDPLAMAQVLKDWCDTKPDRNGVQQSLKKRVCQCLQDNGRTLGLLLCLLMSLPFHSMVTQNYDTLIEQACQKWSLAAIRHGPLTGNTTKRNLSVIPYRPQRKAHYWLLKMHGCVSRPEDIILTEDDYAQYSTSSKARALDGLVQASLLTKHFLFVGFSLTDPNYLRIIDQVREALYRDDPSYHDSRDDDSSQ